MVEVVLMSCQDDPPHLLIMHLYLPVLYPILLLGVTQGMNVPSEQNLTIWAGTPALGCPSTSRFILVVSQVFRLFSFSSMFHIFLYDLPDLPDFHIFPFVTWFP